MELSEIIAEGERLHACYEKNSNGGWELERNEYANYNIWLQTCLAYMEAYHSNSYSIKIFQSRATDIWNNYYSISVISEFLAILKGIRNVGKKEIVNNEAILETIFCRFPIFVQQLKRRHNNRPSIEVKDEYDVQDLLEAILRLHFNDVRSEEWCPSYAGGCNRMDFLLNEPKIAIETKMTREGLSDKQIGDQLIIDIEKYKHHESCEALYCFIYDPDGRIRNPVGVKNDLERNNDGFPVKVYIKPE